eukprot:TRINITY_DN17255_c0_g1_i1.p1 TRINITY_DN17255_c0_g1~~TRINITY_DN17255_c0_g1_i1.p1  ORF type:complete len:124 (-),score=7.30 TRINITY_DN17255_c0_g1_i1:21-392(-)
MEGDWEVKWKGEVVGRLSLRLGANSKEWSYEYVGVPSQMSVADKLVFRRRFSFVDMPKGFVDIIREDHVDPKRFGTVHFQDPSKASPVGSRNFFIFGSENNTTGLYFHGVYNEFQIWSIKPVQ